MTKEQITEWRGLAYGVKKSLNDGRLVDAVSMLIALCRKLEEAYRRFEEDGLRDDDSESAVDSKV